MKAKIGLVALGAALLAGCAGPMAESGGREPAAESMPTVAAAEPISQLHQLSTVTSTSAGVYLAEQGPHGGAYTLYYIAADTGLMSPLCHTKDCAHNSETCQAWFADGQNVFLAADGETLYVAAAEYSWRSRSRIQQTDTFCLTIWAYSLDGQTRTELFKQNVEQPIPELENKVFPMPVRALYYDGSKFYAELENHFSPSNSPDGKTADKTRAFIQIIPNANEYEAMPWLMETVKAADPDFLMAYSDGAVDGKIVLHGYSRQYDSPMEYWVSTDGSEVFKAPTEELHFASENSTKAQYQLCLTESDRMQLWRYAPGEEGQLVMDWDASDQYNEFGDISYYLAIDCLGNAMVYNYAEQHPSYLCLQDGSAVPIELHTSERDTEWEYLKTIAPAGDKILVFLRTEPYSNFSMNYDGEIALDECTIRQYAFLSRKDYESQIPNYQLIHREK